MWVFDSSWYALASTAQRQFRVGLCLLLVLWCEGGYIYSDMVEKHVRCCRQCWLVFAGYDASRAVFPSIVPCVFPLHGGRPMLCGIMVGTDQKDRFQMHKPVVIPLVQFLDKLLRLLDDARGDSTAAVVGQGDMPVVVASGDDGQTAKKTLEIPQVQFLVTVYMPVVGGSGAVCQTAQKTVEILTGAVLGRFRPRQRLIPVTIQQLQFSDKV